MIKTPRDQANEIQKLVHDAQDVLRQVDFALQGLQTRLAEEEQPNSTAHPRPVG